MEGTQLAPYKDSDYTHDHTYFGNGCTGPVDKTSSCSSRIVGTANEGDLKIGTYYSIQAITSGSGAEVTNDNANAPDSFCPLGWQMPYGGTGGDYYNRSKSIQYLLNSYEIKYGTDASTSTDSRAFRSYPLTFIYSGILNTPEGLLGYQSSVGQYWVSTIKNNDSNYRINFWGSAITIDQALTKNFGEPVRCVPVLAS